MYKHSAFGLQLSAKKGGIMGRNIRNYNVFSLAHQAVLGIFKLTDKLPDHERFGLISQMRRCAYSIPMNLVEGAARRTEADFAYFVNISNGPCQEIKYQLELVRDLGYITQKDFEEFFRDYERISKMLYNLEKSIRKS
jgi:four helix bundle protein